jgi:hypothetical protein
LNTAVVTCALVSLPALAAGQTQTAGQKPAAKAAAPASSAKKYIPRRLPWGDPDLQGNFTDKDEANTPFERPEEFAGKQIGDISQQELQKLVEQRQKNAVETAPFITGSRADGIAIGVPIHWLDHLDANNSRPWFVTDPPDGKVPPLTPEANQRAAAQQRARQGRTVADSYTDRSGWDRCISRAVPVAEMQPKIYGNSFQIVQTKDYVAIRYEMVHETRIIPIEGRGAARAHLPATFNSYWGDAIAHFENGTTLVIDTVDFNGKLAFRGSNEGLHTVERFTRTAPNKVEFMATVDDPHTWTRAWSFSIPLTEDDGQPIFEYACHEGNYGLRNILRGAREGEKRGIVPSNGPALPPGKEQEE